MSWKPGGLVSELIEGPFEQRRLFPMKSQFNKFIVHPLSRGFSLVEVTLATSIMALAVTTILGLIPYGMSNVREAGAKTVESQIHRLLVGRMSLTSFSTEGGHEYLRRQYDGQKFYFDDQGMEVPESVARENGLFSYVAQVKVHPLDVMLPAVASGANQNMAADPYLRRVTVLITAASNPYIDLDNTPRVGVRRFCSLLVRCGI